MSSKVRGKDLICPRGPVYAVGPGGLAMCLCCGEVVPLKKGESCKDVKCPKCETKMVRC
ncbi:MAG: hypothetical protein ACUVXA_15155 [Candidatus Jordarchaeum sp.]|uniref:hypothetical protein n=1 Tax=Candidatus Jordarchaeum sp. TaxID=2823881 RepID=UPI00404AD12A